MLFIIMTVGEKMINEQEKHMIHAYDKMKRLNVRPDFDMMYNDVCDFIRPFMDIHMMNAKWNCQSREWENVDKEIDLTKQINKGL